MSRDTNSTRGSPSKSRSVALTRRRFEPHNQAVYDPQLRLLRIIK